MEKADYILKAEYVVTMDPHSGGKTGDPHSGGKTGYPDSGEKTWDGAGEAVISDGAVAVRDGTIAGVGPRSDIEKKFEVSKKQDAIGGDGRRKALMPGFINTHTHAPMVYLRGIADDLPLKHWLEEHIWPIESKWLGPEFINDATELACLEMLKAGITTFNDMYFFEKDAARAIARLGIRAVLGAGILDFPTAVAKNTDEYFERAEEFIGEFLDGELITPSIAPHALYTCGPEGQKRAAAMSEKYNIPLHMHLSETKWETGEIEKRYGQRPVKFLDSLGVLSSRMIAAHCVWLDDEEIEILAERQVGVAHCAESNLKLASGFAPAAKMVRAGIRVTLGTDGAASNNDLNIIGEMSTASKLQKAVSGDPTALDARTVVRMATRWGAEALGLGGKTGSIKKGKAADLIMLDLDKPHLTPMYNIYSHLVNSARPSDVQHVMVAGKLVVEDGRLTTADEQEILEKARRWGEKIGGAGNKGV